MPQAQRLARFQLHVRRERRGQPQESLQFQGLEQASVARQQRAGVRIVHDVAALAGIVAYGHAEILGNHLQVCKAINEQDSLDSFSLP